MLTREDEIHQVYLVNDEEYRSGYHYVLIRRNEWMRLFDINGLAEMADSFGHIDGSRALGFRHALYEIINGKIGGIGNDIRAVAVSYNPKAC